MTNEKDTAEEDTAKKLDPAIAGILVSNLKDALQSVDRYLVVGIVAGLFSLVNAIETRMGSSTPILSIPYLPISTTPGIAVLLSVVIYFVSGVLAAVALRHARGLAGELAGEAQLLRVALKAPSRTAAGDGPLYAIVPPLLLFASYLVETLPASETGASLGLVLGSFPYLFVMVSLVQEPLDPDQKTEPWRVTTWLRVTANDGKSTIDVSPLAIFALMVGIPMLATVLLKLSFDPPTIVEVEPLALTRRFDDNKLNVLQEYRDKRLRLTGPLARIGGTLRVPRIHVADIPCNLIRADARIVAGLDMSTLPVIATVTGVLSDRDEIAIDECEIERTVRSPVSSTDE